MTIANDIEMLKRQEEALRFDRFNEDDAWTLGSMMRARAVEEGLALVIDIQVAGRRLFHTALPGTSPDNGEWVRRKINVVTRLYKCSYRVGRELAASGASLDQSRGVEPIDVAPHGGCFPIHIKGTGVVGTV
ncbi:MAG: heme-degrading domain-containing protein, partial [Oricola sp.]